MTTVDDLYRMLIKVHFKNASFDKGQLVTFSDMGSYAFTLIHQSLVERHSLADWHPDSDEIPLTA